MKRIDWPQYLAGSQNMMVNQKNGCLKEGKLYVLTLDSKTDSLSQTARNDCIILF